jgi:hypothetical protein
MQQQVLGREFDKGVIDLKVMAPETQSAPTPKEMAEAGGAKSPETKKYGTALEKATVGFERFAGLFEPPKELAELTPKETFQKFQDTLSEFLTNRAKAAAVTLKQAAGERREAIEARAQQALDSLLVLSETLGSLPQNIAEIRQREDRKVYLTRVTDRGARHTETFEGISFAIAPQEGAHLLGEPIKRILLDVIVERTGYTPQQIRVNFYGGADAEYELTSLRFDVHHIASENRLQIDLEGRAVELVSLKHHDFPPECSDRETFSQLQHLLAFNLCPTEEAKTKEFYLRQFLKGLGLKGKQAEGRRELVDNIMAQYPGTPQYIAERAQKESAREEEKKQEEMQAKTQQFTSMEQTLEKILASEKDIGELIQRTREEEKLGEEISNGRIIGAYLFGLSSTKKILGRTAEEIAEHNKREGSQSPGVDALNYVGGLIEDSSV